MSRWPWTLPAAAGLAVAALLLSAAALAAQLGQSGPLMWPRTVGFASAHDQKAFDLLGPHPAPAQLTQADAEARRALALSPYDNPARLRLLYIDTLRHGRPTPPGLALLAQSYDLIPYDYTVASWRISFALEHWDALTPDLRSAVFAEALAFGQAHSEDVNVRELLGKVHNPEGRVAAALWLRLLNR